MISYADMYCVCLCLQETIAIMPLIVYTSGFVSTFFSKPFNQYLGRKVCFWTSYINVIELFNQSATMDRYITWQSSNIGHACHPLARREQMILINNIDMTCSYGFFQAMPLFILYFVKHMWSDDKILISLKIV